MGDTISFVSSVESTVTGVRLALNDETTWAVADFQCPPPPLKRHIATNSLRDGGVLAASAYENRVIRMTLELKTASQNASATALQNLARELDRPYNFLAYQVTGMTSPVYFRTLRASPEDIYYWTGTNTVRTVELELVADPFAIGAREAIKTAHVVSNKPSDTETATAGSQRVYLGSWNKGDVPTRPIIVFTNQANGTLSSGVFGYKCFMSMAAYSTGTGVLFVREGENQNMGSDTTAVTAAGPGYSNDGYANVVPTTSTMLARIGPAAPNSPGRYRVIVRAKKTVASDVWKIRFKQEGVTGTPWTGPEITLSSHGDFDHYDLGVIDTTTMGQGVRQWPYNGTDLTYNQPGQNLYAQRVSGTGDLRIDYLRYVPVWDGACYLQAAIATNPAIAANTQWVIDGEQDSEYILNSGTLFSTSAVLAANRAIIRSGDIPWLRPGYEHSLFLMDMRATVDFTQTVTVDVYAYPKYLQVRPAST